MTVVLYDALWVLRFIVRGFALRFAPRWLHLVQILVDGDNFSLAGSEVVGTMMINLIEERVTCDKCHCERNL